MAAGLGVAVLLVVALTTGPRESPDGSTGTALRPGAKLTIAELTDVDGRAVSLAGRPVWLTVGATWCGPCRAEAPDIQAAYAARAGQLQVVAIYRAEDTATVAAFAGRLGLTYPQIADRDGALADRIGVVGLPTHVFTDSSGVVRAVDFGALGPQRIAEHLRAIGVAPA